MGGTNSTLKSEFSQLSSQTSVENNNNNSKDEKICFAPFDVQSPEDEVFPNNVTLHSNLEPIILGYLGTDIDHTKSFTLFGRNNQKLRAPCDIAEKILWSNLDTDQMNNLLAYAEYLAKHDDSFLRTRIHEVQAPNGIVLKNKYFIQILAAMNYFNPRKTLIGDEDFGLVERFAKHLSHNEKREQISEQFPDDWEDVTRRRGAWYYRKFVCFCDELIDMHKTKQLVSEGPTGFILKVKGEGEQIDQKIINLKISNFYDSLKQPPDNEITIGLILHPRVLYHAVKYIRKKFHQRLFGYASDISYALWAGFGVLQKMLSVGDALFILHGIERNSLPNRSLKFNQTVCFNSEFHPDRQFILKNSICYYDSVPDRQYYLNSAGFLAYLYNPEMSEHLKKYCSQKNEVLEDYLATIQLDAAPDVSCDRQYLG